MVGQTFGNYRVLGVCGRGGMGVVYRAEQLRPKRVVALKVIAPELAADDDFRGRFETESDIAASIEHPNVIPVYEVGEHEDQLYLVMRYIEGKDLREVIKEGMSHEAAARMIMQIGAALDAAHKRGLVHRDVKPGNILMAGDHAYLTDFGLTKQAKGDGGGPTKTGTWVGSIDYVAPEQIQAQAVDARTDVYALGAVLFHALAGRVPYERETEVSKLWAHMSEPPPQLEAANSNVPREFQEVVDRAMAKDPADRYASAGDLGRAALAAAQGGHISLAGERSVAAGNAAPAPDPTALGTSQPTRPQDPEGTRVAGADATSAQAMQTQTAAAADAGTQAAAAGAGTQVAGGGATALGQSATAGAGTAPGAAVPARRRGILPFVLGGAALLAVVAVAGVLVLGGGGGEDEGPASAGEIVGTPIAIPPRPTSIGGDGNGVWVASGDEHTITKIDPGSGQIVGDPVRVGRSPYGVAVGEGSVWTANAGDDSVSRVDPGSGKVVGDPIPVGDLPADLTVGLGSVWVANFNDATVTRIDAKSGKVQATISVGEGPTDVAVGEGSVWVTNSGDDTLTRLNPRTNKAVAAAVPVNEEPESVAVGAGSVWVANIRTDTVTRVNAASGQVEGAPIRVGQRPDDVLVHEDAVYVANQDGDTLVRIDPESGEVSEPLQVGNGPIALASSGDALWVVNLDAETVAQVKP